MINKFIYISSLILFAVLWWSTTTDRVWAAMGTPDVVGGLWAQYANRSPGSDDKLWCASRVEPVNFDNIATEYINLSGPGSGCGDSRFNALWGGHIKIDTPGTYIFKLETSVIAQASQFIIDNDGTEEGWDWSGDDEYTPTPAGESVTFTTTGWKHVQMGVYNPSGGGGAPITGRAKLMWDTPGVGGMVPIPGSHLTPEESAQEVITVPRQTESKQPLDFIVTGVSSEENLLVQKLPRYFSVAAWVKAADDNGTILFADNSSADRSVHLRIVNDKVRFSITPEPGVTFMAESAPLTSGWHHIVGVRLGRKDIKLYVDGVEYGGSNTNGNYWYALYNIDWQIGSRNGSSDFFKGKLDDVRIYGRPLTQPEVSSWYSTQVAPKVGLIGHWSFDEAGGSTAISATRHNYHGTMHNGLAGGRDSGDKAPGHAGKSLQFDGSNDYISIAGDPSTEKRIILDLDAQIPVDLSDPQYQLLQNEVLALVTTDQPTIKVNGLTIPVIPLRLHSGRIVNSYVRLPASLIPASGILNLKFEFSSGLEKNSGVVVIVPYTDPSLPMARISLYVSTGTASHSGATPALVFPVQDLSSIKPLVLIFDGETGYIAPAGARPSYVVYKTGTDIASAPGRYDAMAVERNTTVATGSNALGRTGPMDIWGKISKVLFNAYHALASHPARFSTIIDGTSAQLIPVGVGPIVAPVGTNPSAWYPAFGRNGLNMDVLSPNFAANLVTSGETWGNSVIPEISLPANTTWAAMQIYSDNFAGDDPTIILGGPESIGFTTAVGVLSDLDVGEIPSGVPPPTAITAFQPSCPSTDINVVWSEPADTTGIVDYHINRCDAVLPATCDPAVGAPVGVRLEGNSSFTDPGPFVGGRTYFYRVRSHNHTLGEFSPFSATMNATYALCAPPEVTATLTANPPRVAKGGYTNLTWTSTGTSCMLASDTTGLSLTGLPGNSPVGGIDDGPLTANTIYTLTCTDTLTTGGDSKTVSVSVLIFKER